MPMKEIIGSSNLIGAEYKKAEKTLDVHFQNGTAYKYFEVSPETYEEFEKTFDGSSSAGKFFNANIKQHAYEKIDS
jgi:hypothetical protein